FGDQKLVAETHIFDFNKDIYGRPIKLDLLKFLRDEKKFTGVPDLAEQIGRDATEAKKILSEMNKELLASGAADLGVSE
ncbi:MAG: riboflavin kinase, partial [Desulfocapsaceae bacterium]